MKPIEFDWKEGPVSIVWERPDCGIIRFHDKEDSEDYPKYHGVCFAKVGSKWNLLDVIINRLIKWNSNGLCEFKAMAMPGGRASGEQHQLMKGRLSGHHNLKCFSRRLREGEVVVKWY
jgi:hypothetical protein